MHDALLSFYFTVVAYALYRTAQGLYDYTADTRAGCTVFEGPKQRLAAFGRYLVVVGWWARDWGGGLGWWWYT